MAQETLQLKRAYEPPAKTDGFRILVDRLWPRGLTKEKAKIDLWLRDIAPSDELCHWYHHDVALWPEFKKRYFAELKSKKEPLAELKEEMAEGPVTLVFSAKEAEHNNATALAEYLSRSRKRATTDRRR